MSVLADIISNAAPILGKVMNNVLPGGNLIVEGLYQLFGAKTEEDLIDKIKQDKDAFLKLKAFEQQHEAEILRLLTEDKQDARAREIEYTKTTNKREWVVGSLSFIVVFGYFVLVMCAWWANTSWLQSLLKSVLDEWKMCVILILSYYFGSMYKN